MSIVQVLLLLTGPAVAGFVGTRTRVGKWLGPVVIAYLFGMVLANVPLGLSDDRRKEATDLSQNVAAAALMLAIPLLLVGTQVRPLLKVAPRMLSSFLFACIAAVTSSVAVCLLVERILPNARQIAAMLVGVYVGGTSNMAALQLALDVPPDRYMALNAAEVVSGGAYLFLLLMFGPRLSRWILRAPEFTGGGVGPGAAVSDSSAGGAKAGVSSRPAPTNTATLSGSTVPRQSSSSSPTSTTMLGGGTIPPESSSNSAPTNTATHATLSGTVPPEAPPSARVVDWARALGLGVALAALSAGAVFLVYGKLEKEQFVPLLLLLTTAGLGSALIPRIHSIPGTADVGDYCLLIFCVATGTLVSAQKVAESGVLLVALCSVVMLITVSIHILLARLFRIDAGTLLITSTATIFGPPFVPAVARAMKNDALVAPGVTIGLLGLAAGTYLGLATAWVLGI